MVSHIWLNKSVLLLIFYLSDIIFCFIIFFIVDRAVGAPVHEKYYVHGMNDREKWMLKLAMANILNPELIHDYPNFYKFMQVH